MSVKIIQGDCIEVMRTMDSESIDCVVTSPPYWGLRDYGVEGQMGLEPTLGEHLEVMVNVFAEVHRILKPTGTLWLNYGDCYATSPNGRKAADIVNDDRTFRDKPFSTIGAIYDPKHPKRTIGDSGSKHAVKGWEEKAGRIVAGDMLKPKDLCMMSNRLAIELQKPRYIGKIKCEADRIWLAAMIDAEGCMFIQHRKVGGHNGQVYYRKNPSFSSGLEVSNTCKDIVLRCQHIAGMGSICEQGPKQNDRRKQTLYRWNLRSNQCRKIIQEIYPYLIAKQQQARILIGCPSSGELAIAAHKAVIDLHRGIKTDIDFPEPATMYAPGWWVRSEIIWCKPNPMPESVTDRPASSHEKIWLLTKSAKYFYDHEAVKVPAKESSVQRLSQDIENQTVSGRAYAGTKNNGTMKAVGGPKKDKQRGYSRRHAGFNDRWDQMTKEEQQNNGANLKNVWHIGTKPFSEAHFATFPPQLAETCIKAGCPKNACSKCGEVLDLYLKEWSAETNGNDLSVLREEVSESPVSEKSKQILQQKVYVKSKGDREANCNVQMVRESCHSRQKGQTSTVLQPKVFGYTYGEKSKNYKGLDDNNQGIQISKCSGSSECNELWIHDGTSDNYGEKDWKIFNIQRNCSPQERPKTGQQDRKSGDYAENRTRQSSEASLPRNMSELQYDFSNKKQCPGCGSQLEGLNSTLDKGRVFDPFGGAGTTGLVADQLQRDAILIELNPEYIDIAKRRIEADAGMFTEILK